MPSFVHLQCRVSHAKRSRKVLFGVALAATSLWAMASAAAATSASATRLLTLPLTLSAHGGEFLSPSRNISCEIDWDVTGLASIAYCQTFTPAQSATLSSSGTIKTCSGIRCLGNPAENAKVLPYLTSAGAGPFLCASRTDGMACSAAGHAFRISRSGIITYAVLPHTTTAVYTDPASHPTLSKATAYGWLLAVDRSGNHAEVEVECGTGPSGKLLPDRLWTVNLLSIRSFELETNPSDETAGSVVGVSRRDWVGSVRVDGWNGYLELGGTDSLLTDGPGSFTCSR